MQYRVVIVAALIVLCLIPGVMGTPAVKILSVPSEGSSQAWVSGVATDVAPADYAVVVYIKVGSLWWGPKPTYASPLTTIRSDGFWDTTVVTGGYDSTATEYIAYLIPRSAFQLSVMPPDVSGSTNLPASLSAYPSHRRTRPSGTPLPAPRIQREGGADLVGLNFGPYLNAERPGVTTLSESTIRQRLQVVAPNTTWIRTFAVDGGLEHVGPIAHALGKKTAIGAWLSTDLAANKAELEALARVGRAGGADILIVGSETQLRNDVSERALVTYMQWVRDQVPGVPIATADTYAEFTHHRAVVEASDILLVNIYPFWESVSIDSALSNSRSSYSQALGAAQGRPVVISEMGWPDAGSARGLAVPNTANAARYFRDATAWTHAEGIPYFYFEAFDEAWKTTEPGGVGPHWGIWDGSLRLKPGRLTPESLTAAFTATPTAGRAPLSVRFSDASTGTPTSWVWSFGDGTTSTLTNPSHTYATAGTYTVTLTVRNAAGQSKTETKTNLITVGSSPAPWRVPHVLPCVVEAEDYDTNGPGSAYSDTTTTNEGRTYRTDAVDIEAISGGYTLCYIREGEWTKYTVESPTAASYPVTLRVANWATSPARTIEIQVDGATQRTVTVPYTGSTSTFRTIQTTLTIPAGRHAVTLKYHGGSMNLDSMVFGTAPAPILTAAFTATPTSGTAPLTVQFTDASTGSPTSWSWSFGDGTTSTMPSPSHTYQANGAYTVSLTVRNAAGQSKTETKTNLITVGSSPAPWRVPHVLPCVVEAEDYDTNGPGSAYSDTTTTNEGRTYRTDAVDIEAISGGYTLCYIREGEWTKYTVESPTAASYPVTLRVANWATSPARTIEIQVDGATQRTVTVPYTGSTSIFRTVQTTLSVPAGRHTVTLRYHGGSMNLDWFRVGS